MKKALVVISLVGELAGFAAERPATWVRRSTRRR